MKPVRLKVIEEKDIPPRGEQVYDTDTLDKVRGILCDIQSGGEATIRSYAEKFGDISAGQNLFIP